MRSLPLAAFASTCLFCLAVVTGAEADQFVQFDSAPVKPSPFLERKAKEAGQTIPVAAPTPLQGYLTVPPGKGPFPAVVLLHGCAGLHQALREQWPQRLASWGYAALVVDSFTTRGIKNTCDHLLPDRVYDAYGALDFLSKNSVVDPDRIALMGFSAGGIATLDAEHLGGAERLFDRNFRAAVAYYPLCPETGDMAIPTLILSGELDDFTPVDRCRKMMAHRTGDGGSVQLITYPEAWHSFDVEKLKPGVYFGHRQEFNQAAAEKSFNDVHGFLRQTLGR